MAVAFEEAGTFTTSASGSSLAIDAPSNIAEGNLLFAIVGALGADITGMTGWTELHVSVSLGNDQRGGYFYKVAQAGDVGVTSYSVSFSASTEAGGIIYRISGNDTVTPISASSFSDDTTVDTSAQTTTITPDANCLLILASVIAETNGIATTGSGYTIATDDPTWTERHDNAFASNDLASCAATALRSQDSATGTATITISRSTAQTTGLIAVKPAAAAAGAAPAIFFGCNF